MEFFDVINTRLTIRKYKPDMPPVGDIEKVIDAGRLAPSANNYQNWEFIVIKNKNILEEMREAVTREYDNLAKLTNDEELIKSLTGHKNYGTFFTNAPVVIAIVEQQGKSSISEFMKKLNYSPEKIAKLRPSSSLLSMGAAIENMSLAAHALGYGTCWMVAPIIGAETFSKMFNLKDNEQVISLLTLGIPFTDKYQAHEKKSLKEVMRVID